MCRGPGRVLPELSESWGNQTTATREEHCWVETNKIPGVNHTQKPNTKKKKKNQHNKENQKEETSPSGKVRGGGRSPTEELFGRTVPSQYFSQE